VLSPSHGRKKDKVAQPPLTVAGRKKKKAGTPFLPTEKRRGQFRAGATKDWGKEHWHYGSGQKTGETLDLAQKISHMARVAGKKKPLA